MSLDLVTTLERPINAGVQFLWAISLGQLISIFVGVIAFFGTLIKLGSIFLSLQKGMASMEKRMDDRDEHVNILFTRLNETIAAVERDSREDTRELRISMQDLNKTLLSIKIIAVDLGHNSRGELGD